MPPHSSGDHALARFLRTVGTAALQLAQDLEAGSPPEQGWLSLEHANLGALQQQVTEAPALDNEAGVSPREITLLIGRDDEPNVRAALAALEKRGVAEQVPGVSPQRWRLARPYLPEPGISRYRYCERCGYEFAGKTVKQYCTYRSACDRRVREPGYRVPKGRTQNMEIRNATLAASPESGTQ